LREAQRAHHRRRAQDPRLRLADSERRTQARAAERKRRDQPGTDPSRPDGSGGSAQTPIADATSGLARSLSLSSPRVDGG
jgi:hypothetical protein